jgi:hypothetical protein
MDIYSRWLDGVAVILAAGLTVVLIVLIETAPW